MNALIEKEVAEFFHENLELPEEVILSVASVRTASDLKHATVTITVHPERQGETVLALVTAEKAACEQFLYRRLVMKCTPRLAFALDTSSGRADRITRLLDRLKQE